MGTDFYAGGMVALA